MNQALDIRRSSAISIFKWFHTIALVHPNSACGRQVESFAFFEKKQIETAIRTDLILSIEINGP